MSQLTATFMKTAKFFIRNRALLLGIVAWPMALMVIMASTELGSVSASDMPKALGALTVDMLVFALMLACVMNLPSSIARDREIGLLVKLRSMPINPGIDTLGRLLAYLAFAVVVSGLVILLGLGLGAQFSGSAAADLEAVGFLLMAAVAAAGIGLILGSFIKSVQGTAFLGLAVTLALAFTSGILVPYNQLSAPLQAFSRAFPISSAASSIGYLLLGQDVAGYDPLALSQIATGIVVAVALLAIGLVIYHRTSWRQGSARSSSSNLGAYRRRRHHAKASALNASSA
ncbi:MAG: ABC transporter permease [Nitrososphaerales archaeon]|jgi:ABC-2 type transport system permease protein